VNPNDAHIAIQKLEDKYDVTVITQNVDDLHERAGSTDIIHLHGELNKVRSTGKSALVYDWTEDLNLGDQAADGFQLRPHIVWFGEILNEDHLFTARKYAVEADYCIVVGTSMAVYPANEIPQFAAPECEIFLVDPNADEIPFRSRSKITRITEKATVGMQKVLGMLK
jgi:NAD-dependent deacetylase